MAISTKEIHVNRYFDALVQIDDNIWFTKEQFAKILNGSFSNTTTSDLTEKSLNKAIEEMEKLTQDREDTMKITPTDKRNIYAAQAQSDQQEYIDEMEAKGFTIMRPKPNQIFLDLDSKEALDGLEQRIQDFKQIIELNPNRQLDLSEFSVKISPSKTPGHYHGIITFYNVDTGNVYGFPIIDKLVLQLILGSDYKKELLSFIRELNCENENDIILLARPKG